MSRLRGVWRWSEVLKGLGKVLLLDVGLEYV